MIDETKLEDVIARGVRRGIIEGLASVIAAGGLGNLQATTQEAPKATRQRKPKEEVPPVAGTGLPPVVVDPVVFDAAHGLAPAFPTVAAPTPVVAQAQADQAASAPVNTLELKAERGNVGRALMTIVNNPDLGPLKAKEVLAAFGAKVVDDLDPSNYLAVVEHAAGVLKITIEEALKLEIKK